MEALSIRNTLAGFIGGIVGGFAEGWFAERGNRRREQEDLIDHARDWARYGRQAEFHHADLRGAQLPGVNPSRDEDGKPAADLNHARPCGARPLSILRPGVVFALFRCETSFILCLSHYTLDSEAELSQSYWDIPSPDLSLLTMLALVFSRFTGQIRGSYTAMLNRQYRDLAH